METLLYILKALGIIVLILILVRILIAIITEPFKERKNKKAIQEMTNMFFDAIEKELEKQEKEKEQETPKKKRKYTKRTINKKDN